MGTEVQSKMHLPGYYSLRDLNGSNGKVNWPLHHENKNPDPYYNLFSTRPAIDFGYNSEQLRKTILKHESIFRHQLHELHRLYAIQREMMNELKSKELNKHPIHADTLRSTPFPSGLLSQDERKNHGLESRMLDSGSGRLFISGNDSSHSQYNPSKDKFLQSGCSSSPNGLGLKNGALLESRYKNVQRTFIDLERPADEYTSEGDGDPGASSVSGTNNYPSRRTCEIPYERERKLAINNGSSYSCNGDAANSSLLWGSRGYGDLNKPMQVQEIPRQHLSSGSQPGFLCSATEISHNSNKEKEEMERRQKGWFPFGLENGCTRSTNSFSASFHPQELNKQTKPVQPSNTETSAKRKIFGVEIPETSDGISARATLAVNGTSASASASASHSLDQIAMRLRSDKTNSEILSASTWDKFPSSWNQNVQGNPGNSTLSQLNGRVAEGKLPPQNGLRPDVLNQNGFYFGSSSESADSRVRWPSVGFSNQNGSTINHFASERFAQGASRDNYNSKALVDLNTAALPVYQIESASQLISNGAEKQEIQHGVPSWLRASQINNGKATKDTEVSCQIETKGPDRCFIQDSLSATSVTNADHRKKEADCNSSSKKILGFPIFEVKSKDLPSLSSTLNSAFSASAKGTDQQPPESRGQPMNAEFKQPIDLNLCFDEEEIEEDAQPPLLSSKTNMRISAVIDLEAPASIDLETETASGFDSEPQQPTTDTESTLAEALVAFSSSRINNHVDDGSLRNLESSATASDSLQWFAEIITSHRSDSESDSEDRIPNGLDYFELMTLNLAESKEEEECHFPPVPDEKPSTRRPRRGQARRGRQRRDFQRDVLPALTSLSRNEVTRDLQEIEGLIQATGGNWISSLTQKNNARNSSGRGRKRSGGSVSVPVPVPPSSSNVTPVEAVTEERSLTGWGKRTRRPPRQRCPISINNPLLPVK